MKTHICINVDVEALMLAKTKIHNISDYLNSCLKGLVINETGTSEETELKAELDALENTLLNTHTRKTILETQLKILIETKERERVEQKDREKNKRWLCPIPRCETLNNMENLTCQNCGSKTRDSTKTVIKYIEA